VEKDVEEDRVENLKEKVQRKDVEKEEKIQRKREDVEENNYILI